MAGVTERYGKGKVVLLQFTGKTKTPAAWLADRGGEVIFVSCLF